MNIHARSPRTLVTCSLAVSIGLLGAAAAQGALVAHEDFSTYPVGTQLTTVTGSPMGFTGVWESYENNEWWGQAITSEGPVHFDDQMLVSGNAYNWGHGRLQQKLTTPVTTGVLWISYVFNPKNLEDAGENQFWICNGEIKDQLFDPLTKTYSEVAESLPWMRKFNAVAGLRVLAQKIMYYDTSKDWTVSANEDDPATTEVNEDNPLTVGGEGEVYQVFSLDGVNPELITGPLLMTMKIDIGNKTVSYYVFRPGEDYSDTVNALLKVENLAISADRLIDSKVQVAGIALFSVANDRSEAGNIRFATNFKEVTPTLNEIVWADMTRAPFELEDTTWAAAASPLYISKFWADADKNVVATDNADFSAGAYVSWDMNNLYVAVAVTDDQVIDSGEKRDQIEVYLDGDMSRGANLGWPTNYDKKDDFQLIFTLDGSMPEGVKVEGPGSWNPTGNPAGFIGPKGGLINTVEQTFPGISYLLSKTGNGYVLTAIFDLSDVLGINAPMVGQMIGFDVAVVDHDDNAGTFQKSHYFGSDSANANWNGTQNFGTVFLMPSTQPIAWDDFSGYEVNESLGNQGEAGNGWNGPWYTAWKPSWNPNPKPIEVKEGPIVFQGDLLASGHRVGGSTNNFARLARRLVTPLANTGSYWVGFVMNTGGHLQVRLDTKNGNPLDPPNDPVTNLDPTSVAGWTMSGGEIQVLDTSKSPTFKDTITGDTTAEVYVPMSAWPYPQGDCFYVLNVDYDAGMVHYYVFFPGDDVGYPTNATLQDSFALHAERAHTFDSLAIFSVFSDVSISGLRIGDDFGQLIPPAAVDPVMPAVATMAPVAPVLDGVVDEVWTAATEYPIELIHGGKSIPDSDLSATWRALWDEDNLYLLFTIHDDQIIKNGDTTHPDKDNATPAYQNDEFEIFIDGGYNRTTGPGWPTVYDADDIQMVFSMKSDNTFTGKYSDFQYNNWAQVSGKAVTLPTGFGTGMEVNGALIDDNNYVAEVKIPRSSFGLADPMAAGDTLGLDLQLNDRDLPQEPPAAGDADKNYIYPSDGKRAWADGENAAWRATDHHGSLYLSNQAVDAFKFIYEPSNVSRNGATAKITVTSRFQYSDWTASKADTAQSWLTIAENATGTGDGELQVTLAATTEAYTRYGLVKVGNNTAKVKQAGLLSTTNEKILKTLKPKAGAEGTFTHDWIGDTTINKLPWLYTTQHGWLYFFNKSTPDATWLWDTRNGWIFSGAPLATGNAAKPTAYWYAASLGKWMWYIGNGIDDQGATVRWFYIYESDGTGAWTALPLSM